MANRTYRSPVRDDAMQETIRRIVLAAVELHAERGALGTTHADVAERAGVSVPTVYKHFPTRAALLPSCVAHVSGGAPHVDDAALAAIRDVDARIDALVGAVHAEHAHFAPWLRWSYAEAARMPELAAELAAQDRRLRARIATVLAPAFRGRTPKIVMALARTLLHFTAWQRLQDELNDGKAARRATALAIRLVVANALEEKST